MPAEGVPDLTPSADLLTRQEIMRVARMFVAQGVTKIRLTGGEPTVRRDIVDLVADLGQLKDCGLKSLAMTTNALVLERKLEGLQRAGLDSVNISLDTLDPHMFELITRRRGLDNVLRCIDRAVERGLQVKVNCVVIRGLNDQHCVDFLQLIKHTPIVVRFIEYMPFDGNQWNNKKLVPYTEIIQGIELKSQLKLLRSTDDANDTSKHFSVDDHVGRLAFITSMSDHFCGTCNRLRITSDGNIKVCLFGPTEVSLRDQMRSGCTDDELVEVVQSAVWRKKKAHAGMSKLSVTKNRPMVMIGG